GMRATFTETGTAGSAEAIAGIRATSETGTATCALTMSPSVIVKDANGNPVAQVAVTFAVAPGNGTITGASQTTNASGVATVGSWTLSATAGPNTLTATSGSLTGSPVTFTATGTAGAAATIAANSPTSQSATAGTAVRSPPSVIVKEAGREPWRQVAVTFTPAAGSGSGTGGARTSKGSVTGGTQTTNGSGIATVGSWTLSATAGSNTLTATSGSLTGSPVTFTATGTAGAAATIAPNSPTSPTAPAGTAVSPPPSVIVKDANGNPVTGVAVTFTPAEGSGTVTPPTPVSTGTDGIAALTSWTLSATAGQNTLTVTSSGLTGSAVRFQATWRAGAATHLALVTAR